MCKNYSDYQSIGWNNYYNHRVIRFFLAWEGSAWALGLILLFSRVSEPGRESLELQGSQTENCKLGWQSLVPTKRKTSITNVFSRMLQKPWLKAAQTVGFVLFLHQIGNWEVSRTGLVPQRHQGPASFIFPSRQAEVGGLSLHDHKMAADTPGTTLTFKARRK